MLGDGGVSYAKMADLFSSDLFSSLLQSIGIILCKGFHTYYSVKLLIRSLLIIEKYYGDFLRQLSLYVNSTGNLPRWSGMNAQRELPKKVQAGSKVVCQQRDKTASEGFLPFHLVIQPSVGL